MAEGDLAQGLAVLALAASAVGAGFYVALLNDCILFGDPATCDARGRTAFFASGLGGLLGAASVGSVLTGESAPRRLWIALGLAAMLVGASLFALLGFDAPQPFYPYLAGALLAIAGIVLLASPIAWRKAAIA